MRSAALLAALVVGALAASSARAADAPAAAARTPEQAAALRRTVLAGLADKKAAARVAAADLLVCAWPDSAPILDEALASKSAAVRIEAVRILERKALGDVRDRLRKLFDDADPAVRRQAVRSARHVAYDDVEKDLVDLAGDPSWLVRQEALYGLETAGTTKCLRPVLMRFVEETDVGRRARLRRVLAKVLGVDCGDDVDAWRTAVDKAEKKARAGGAVVAR